jgi:hypothetical protein
VLRVIGFQPGMVRLAFIAEASFVPLASTGCRVLGYGCPRCGLLDRRQLRTTPPAAEERC